VIFHGCGPEVSSVDRLGSGGLQSHRSHCLKDGAPWPRRERSRKVRAAPADTKKPARGGLEDVVVNSHAVHGYGKYSLAEATCCFSRRGDFDAPV
jgi:hypothetical protein